MKKFDRICRGVRSQTSCLNGSEAVISARTQKTLPPKLACCDNSGCRYCGGTKMCDMKNNNGINDRTFCFFFLNKTLPIWSWNR